MNTNPYDAPTSNFTVPEFAPIQNDVLASRSTRFVGALIDGILLLLAAFPIMFLVAMMLTSESDENEDDPGAIIEILMIFAAFGIMFAMNGYLLMKRGQTIGKYLLKTQIVDATSRKLLPIMRVFVFRYLWILPVSIVLSLIPGADRFENIFNLIDAVMIFGASHRCLHDYLAGSIVVMYQPNRQHL